MKKMAMVLLAILVLFACVEEWGWMEILPGESVWGKIIATTGVPPTKAELDAIQKKNGIPSFSSLQPGFIRIQKYLAGGFCFPEQTLPPGMAPEKSWSWTQLGVFGGVFLLGTLMLRAYRRSPRKLGFYRKHGLRWKSKRIPVSAIVLRGFNHLAGVVHPFRDERHLGRKMTTWRRSWRKGWPQSAHAVGGSIKP